MASSAEYLEYVLDLLRDVPVVTHRKMMGEYLIYFCGTVVGGVYDNRFLLKKTISALKMLPGAQLSTPYSGGKEMIVADSIKDKIFLRDLINAIFGDIIQNKR